MARTRNEVITAGQNIRSCLSASETSVDTGLIAQAHLVAALLTARLDLGFAPQFQRELVYEAATTLTEGLAQRERLLALHERLTGLAARFKIDPKLLGDSGDKDGDDAMPYIPATGGLSVVASA